MFKKKSKGLLSPKAIDIMDEILAEEAIEDAKNPNRASTLPTDSQARKHFPVATGVLDYFPDAMVAIAEVSYAGNEQHNPGEPLHWARGKSMDQDDTLIRHFLERGKKDKDGLRHSAKMAWRALAILQLEIESERTQFSGEPGTFIPGWNLRKPNPLEVKS